MHFHRELDLLRKKLLEEGAAVEEAIDRSIRALHERDTRLANQVLVGDREIDQLEIDVEEECLKVLALYQPVAVDLRFIVAALKMNNDLERMGDIAVSLARRALFLSKRDPIDFPVEISRMGELSRQMVKKSLDALINSDVALAREVCMADDEVDALKRTVGKMLRQRVEDEPQNTRVLLKVLDIPRHLERLADLATNIAEDVIYLVDGEIVRHKRMLGAAADQQNKEFDE